MVENGAGRDGRIVWEDPPDILVERGQTAWIRRLAPLMEKPERWARLPGTYSASTLTVLRTKARKPPGAWEFRSYRAKPGAKEITIYARYLGKRQRAMRGSRKVTAP